MSKRMSLRRIFELGYSLQYQRVAKYVSPSVKGDNIILSSLRNMRERLKLENLGAEIIDEISKVIKELDAKYNEGDDITREHVESI